MFKKVPGDAPSDPPMVVGLELHYKVKVVEETEVVGAIRKMWASVSDFVKGTNSQEEKNKTIIMLAYKAIAKTIPNIMDPEKLPDKKKVAALRF